MENIYYNGNKILNIRDIDGEKPEIFMITSNRNAGKTTFFGRWFLNRFFNYHEKFVLLCRYNYELEHIAENFFKNLKYLFFPEWDMRGKGYAKGKYQELFIGKDTSDEYQSCGYALALNDSETIRRISPAFADAQKILFDEFQSETYHYCKDEILKFQSIHTSLARGGGKQIKYLPIYMLSNCNTLLNPYYTAMGIGARLRKDTKFLRGPGWVLEQNINTSAQKALKESRFNKAFAGSKYLDYAAENIYLHDNMGFIDNPSGRSRYIATLRYNNIDFAIRLYDSGIYYCDKRVDKTFSYRISATKEDHTINYIMLTPSDFMIMDLRHNFRLGNFRFYDLQSKEAIMKLVSF